MTNAPDPSPDFDDRRTFSSGQASRFNVRVLEARAGSAELRLDIPFGDERDDDPLFAAAALHYAADIVALQSVRSRIDPARERPNGTASLHLNLLAEPQGGVTLRADVVYWSPYEALSEIAATDDAGQAVARGLSAYSLRPAHEGTPA
jgi:hypothetical protein